MFQHSLEELYGMLDGAIAVGDERWADLLRAEINLRSYQHFDPEDAEQAA